ncbi:hypothetical protein [Streptomyces sp. NPDC098781]|uniref:hypothetical protein n=1 Tax=Streptomyces sp. NPDC098781 TaxID=3366097 RepID=UPI0037F2321B
MTVAFVVLASVASWALTGGPSWEGDYSDLPGLARWVLAAISEPQFYAVGSAGALLFAGGLIGHIAHRRGWYLQGFIQACGTGIWPSVAGAALLSVVLSALLWGATLAGGTWQPSLVPAAVLTYDGALVPTVVAALVGALVAPPTAAAISTRLPAGFHPFVGNVAAMSICTALIVPLLSFLPGVQ